MPRINQDENAREILAIDEVIVHGVIEFFFVLPRHLRESVTGQIDQAPRIIDREKIDHLGVAGSFGNFGEILSSGQRVEQRRFADVGATDESEFRQRDFGTRFQIGRAASKSCGGNIHFSKDNVSEKPQMDTDERRKGKNINLSGTKNFSGIIEFCFPFAFICGFKFLENCFS
jgi:hypothetical protein